MMIIQHGELQVEYTVFGTGTTTVIALHGHSKDVFDFKSYGTENVRVIAMSLFHHGSSTFPAYRINSDPLKTAEFLAFVEGIIQIENVKDFHLMGFSQGGRFALKIFEYYAERVISFSLLSPDGIALDSFYDKAAKIRVNMFIMDYLENKPKIFLRTLFAIKKLGFVHSKVYELAVDFTQNKETMIRASRTWRNFRKIRSNPKLIGDLVLKHRTEFKLIMGKYDGIFPPANGYNFEKKAGLSGCVTLIESGHDFFKPSTKLLFNPLLPFVNNPYLCSKEKQDAEDS
jgi:pimeloyl-ACP methyl ester carboxylesterase